MGGHSGPERFGDRLRRLAVFADHVPRHARPQVADRIDELAKLLGRATADTDE